MTNFFKRIAHNTFPLLYKIIANLRYKVNKKGVKYNGKKNQIRIGDGGRREGAREFGGTSRTLAVESAPISATSDGEVPFEKLHKVVMTSFADEFAEFKKSTGRYYNHDIENIWAVINTVKNLFKKK